MNAHALALFLAHNTHAIAANQHAATCYNDIQHAINEIERLINRPIQPIECGPCPTLDKNQNICAVGLSAKRGEIEVCCWKCKTTYNIERLIQKRLNEVPNLMFTTTQVLRVMARIGEPIPDSTWRRWRAQGTIQPAGELYGEPSYNLDDVRKQRRNYTRAHAS